MSSEAAYFPNALAGTGEVCDESTNSRETVSEVVLDVAGLPVVDSLSGISDEELMEQVGVLSQGGFGCSIPSLCPCGAQCCLPNIAG